MSVTTTNTSNPMPNAVSQKPRQYFLNTTHRCDRCGTQAYVKVILNKVNEETGHALYLLFCKHHHNEYELALMPVVKQTIDESERLVSNRLMGSENS